MPKGDKESIGKQQRYEPYVRRSTRHRVSPREAEEERELAARQEAAERLRKLEASKAYAAELQQARLNEKPVEASDRSALDNIAYNVHYAYNWGSYGDQCVTAVIIKQSGNYKVFCQRYMKTMEQYADKHYTDSNLLFKPGCGYDHMHAEMYAVWYYLNRGLDPGEQIKAMGVSKPICPDCQRVLNYLGINYNQRWTTTERSDHWKDPWRHLSKETVLAVAHWDPAERDEEGED